MKINEIFYSLQGEGNFTGHPAIFVRFAGCNLSCDFCDTQHQHGVDMAEDEIIFEVSKYPAGHVVLTGGEPTLQITASLITKLHKAGKFVQIETNGTRPISEELLKLIDWITCSPKYGHAPNIQRIDELKIVFDRERLEDIDKLNHVEATFRQCYYLQPCDRGDEAWNAENLNACINFILVNPKWKLSLQTQKMLNLR